jgi:hypothetical protein
LKFEIVLILWRPFGAGCDFELVIHIKFKPKGHYRPQMYIQPGPEPGQRAKRDIDSVLFLQINPYLLVGIHQLFHHHRIVDPALHEVLSLSKLLQGQGRHVQARRLAFINQGRKPDAV